MESVRCAELVGHIGGECLFQVGIQIGFAVLEHTSFLGIRADQDGNAGDFALMSFEVGLRYQRVVVCRWPEGECLGFDDGFKFAGWNLSEAGQSVVLGASCFFG